MDELMDEKDIQLLAGAERVAQLKLLANNWSERYGGDFDSARLTMVHWDKYDASFIAEIETWFKQTESYYKRLFYARYRD